jgi:signal transduction histidine kinase
VPIGTTAGFAFGAVPLLVAFLGFLVLSPRRSLLLLGALWIGTLAASALALQFAALWWPPAAALAVLTAAYPLWNWRRLEATQRFLDEEFTRLMAERTPLARDPAPALAMPGAGGDPLQRRIDLVDAATTRLRDLRRLLSDTIANLPDAALVVDRDARVVLANPVAAALFTAGDAETLLDAPLASLFEAAFETGLIDLDTLLGAQPRVLEARTRAGRAGAQDYLLRAAPFHDDAGERLGTILSLADITSLRDLQRERDELVGFLSHDIRSPVTSLLALTQLQRDPQRALAPEQFARRAEALAQRSLELAEGFIALARAEAVEHAAFESFDLRDAVQDALDETWAAAELRGIALRFAPSATIWPVYGHRGLLARALANLVGNAVKFAPAGTAVTVAGGRHGNDWEIRVIDAGPGIDDALRGRLFGRFQRGAAARDASPATRDPGGSGLGLAFVRVVATRHGGEVGVRSAVADAGAGSRTGSEFYLRIAARDHLAER